MNRYELPAFDADEFVALFDDAATAADALDAYLDADYDAPTMNDDALDYLATHYATDSDVDDVIDMTR